MTLALAVSVSPATAQDKINLPQSWADAHVRCKGGAGNDLNTYRACGRRDAFAMVLIDQGFCWRRDLPLRWAKCRPEDPKPILDEFITVELKQRLFD